MCCFCGNALAAHDMEASLYGTSLGYNLGAGRTVPHGHEHHLRTINRIRDIGSIEKAVKSGIIRDGVMAACIRHDVDVVMAGTIRDDGPLPGVITDSMQAQSAMRAALPGVGVGLVSSLDSPCGCHRKFTSCHGSNGLCRHQSSCPHKTQ